MPFARTMDINNDDLHTHTKKNHTHPLGLPAWNQVILRTHLIQLCFERQLLLAQNNTIRRQPIPGALAAEGKGH